MPMHAYLLALFHRQDDQGIHQSAATQISDLNPSRIVSRLSEHLLANVYFHTKQLSVDEVLATLEYLLL